MSTERVSLMPSINAMNYYGVRSQCSDFTPASNQTIVQVWLFLLCSGALFRADFNQIATTSFIIDIILVNSVKHTMKEAIHFDSRFTNVH
jgi:hypothetical protein